MTGPYRSTLTSAFPRPEALVQATRDLDRGRIPPTKAEAEFGAAEAAVRRVEEDLQLDAITGGYLRWPDLFRPFTSLWSGVSVGPLTRFFETNTFYRQPVLEDAPRPGHGRLSDWLPAGPANRAILPGPYTFARMAECRYSPRSGSSVTLDLASALADQIRSLGPDRPAYLQFQEPMLVYEPPAAETEELVEAYRRLAEASSGAATSVWTYFADAGPGLATVARLPVDVVGFDLFETDVPNGIPWGSKGIGLGCVDPHTTISEDVTTVARLVRRVEERLAPREVWLGPNPPLDLLPFDAAVAKLRILPQLRGVLRG